MHKRARASPSRPIPSLPLPAEEVLKCEQNVRLMCVLYASDVCVSVVRACVRAYIGTIKLVCRYVLPFHSLTLVWGSGTVGKHSVGRGTVGNHEVVGNPEASVGRRRGGCDGTGTEGRQRAFERPWCAEGGKGDKVCRGWKGLCEQGAWRLK